MKELELDIKVGDVLLGGRYKNKRIVVKKIGTDEPNVLYFNPDSTYVELA